MPRRPESRLTDPQPITSDFSPSAQSATSADFSRTHSPQINSRKARRAVAVSGSDASAAGGLGGRNTVPQAASRARRSAVIHPTTARRGSVGSARSPDVPATRSLRWARIPRTQGENIAGQNCAVIRRSHGVGMSHTHQTIRNIRFAQRSPDCVILRS
jgi:hypothetical protein